MLAPPTSPDFSVLVGLMPFRSAAFECEGNQAANLGILLIHWATTALEGSQKQ